MAKIISIINIKGGVGKTTIAFNLAHAIAKLERCVLLCDLDMQSNLTDLAAFQSTLPRGERPGLFYAGILRGQDDVVMKWKKDGEQ